MKEQNLLDFLKRDDSAMVRASTIRKIEDIFSTCNKIPIAKLLTIILRKRGEVQNDPFYWSDKNFLKKLEQYTKEFQNTYNPETGEFDLNEEKC